MAKFGADSAEGVGLRIAPWQRGVHRWTPSPVGRRGPATASGRPALWKRCKVETTKVWHHFWSHLGDDFWFFLVDNWLFRSYMYNYMYIYHRPTMHRYKKIYWLCEASANNYGFMSVNYDFSAIVIHHHGSLPIVDHYQLSPIIIINHRYQSYMIKIQSCAAQVPWTSHAAGLYWWLLSHIARQIRLPHHIVPAQNHAYTPLIHT